VKGGTYPPGQEPQRTPRPDGLRVRRDYPGAAGGAPPYGRPVQRARGGRRGDQM